MALKMSFEQIAHVAALAGVLETEYRAVNLWLADEGRAMRFRTVDQAPRWHHYLIAQEKFNEYMATLPLL